MEKDAQENDHRYHFLVSGKVFERVFTEGMALVEETASYLDGLGRKQARALPREANLTYAAWSMEVSTRLMQAASWLVMQKSVREGDMTRLEAGNQKYRLTNDQPALNTTEQEGLGLPEKFLTLVERSEALYEQICRLDHALYVETPGDGPPSAVSDQWVKLQRAAEKGAFDPLRIWADRS